MLKPILKKPHYYNFHKDASLNFQLNRVHTNSACSVEELYEIAKKLKGYSDVTPVFRQYLEKARSEGRMLDALFYCRIAEFFCLTDQNEKRKLYNEFRSLFYELYRSDQMIEHEVPYGNGALSALECLPLEGLYKGTIIFHGGGDSFIEEFYTHVDSLCRQGYRVIMFDGPGQGQTLFKYGIKMTHQWEKPVAAVLDYFNLSEVTLMGISLGGYFAARAAAFEKRIKHVVLWGVVYDFFECIYGRESLWKYHTMNTLVHVRAKSILNSMAKRQIEKKPEMKWIHEHSLFVHGVPTTYDFMKRLKYYSTKDISHLIEQDVLILVGRDDHIIPYRMYERQIKALTNARSVRGRVFTREEHASSHCQVGNIGAAITEIVQWMESI